jgi:GxxExxY protein
MQTIDHLPIPSRTNEIARAVVDSAIKVHSALGPGLLEKTYCACLAHELTLRGYAARVQVPVPVVYEGLKLKLGYRIDILVEECVVIELKSVEALHPIHQAQTLTYLQLSGHRLGLLMNFNVVLMKNGIKRLVR